MKIETKIIMRPSDGVLVMSWTIHPRGSGNRPIVRRLAQAAAANPELAPHIVKTVVGSTRLTIHLRASLALMKAVNEIARKAAENASKDVEGQLPLFGSPTLA